MMVAVVMDVIQAGAPVGLRLGCCWWSFSRWWLWCCCDIKNGQQEIKCLIENTAKDQEIARLNRVVDAQRDQNIIQSVVAALKTTTTTPA